MMLGDLEADLAAPGGRAPADSLHWQWCHLEQWLEVHLAFEQTELYPQLRQASAAHESGRGSRPSAPAGASIAPGAASRAPLGIRVAGAPSGPGFNPDEELQELRQLLEESRRRFAGPQSIAGDLPGFRIGLAAIAARVRARIRREQALVYPAVADIDASRLPASTARLPQ